MTRLNVDRMKRYAQGGRAARLVTQPYPVANWYRTEPLPAGTIVKFDRAGNERMILTDAG